MTTGHEVIPDARGELRGVKNIAKVTNIILPIARQKIKKRIGIKSTSCTITSMAWRVAITHKVIVNKAPFYFP